VAVGRRRCKAKEKVAADAVDRQADQYQDLATTSEAMISPSMKVNMKPTALSRPALPYDSTKPRFSVPGELWSRLSSHHLIFYSLKTVVKRNCVYKVHTHTYSIMHGDKYIDIGYKFDVVCEKSMSEVSLFKNYSGNRRIRCSWLPPWLDE